MSKVDDGQWIDARKGTVDVTSGESVISKMTIPRILADYQEWNRSNPVEEPYPIIKARNPFRIHDNETLIYTDHLGREYLIEITAHLITEDEDEQRRERSAQARRLVRNKAADATRVGRVRDRVRTRVLDQES